MNQDLAKMKPQLFPDNKVFCLTPEHKIDKWIKIIQQKALEGYKVKLYSDIESTGFAYWNRGRAMYDEVMDGKLMRKDAQKFALEIEVLTNKAFPIKLTHPLCSNKYFDIKEPSNLALFVFGENVLTSAGYNYSDYEEKMQDETIDMQYYNDTVMLFDRTLKNDLMVAARSGIKSMENKAFRTLKQEAIELASKVDRMIEYAFVTCYENQDGEVFLLKDEEGDLIYFHEFVYPTDGKIKEEQTIEKMPLIPYIIHKSSFEFLRGEEEHPFLKIKLDKQAPNAGEIFRVLLRLFECDGSPKEKETLADNINMFFHNGNGFDVPFLDEEMNRYFEDKKVRDLVQTYDTLDIAKAFLPSDAQKFIAACQHNKNFGGNEELKNDPERGILPTSKSLDNVKRLATYLIDFDPNKPRRIYEKAQNKFFDMFKTYFENENIDWQKFENMVEYASTKNPDLNLTKGFKKPTKSEKEYQNLMDRYSKYQEGRKEYVKLLNNLKKHEKLYKNINDIRQNIENNDFLKEALYRLNNVDRSAHGARVDSQLFMDAFIVMENAFYLKPKMSSNKRSIEVESLEIPEAMRKLLDEKLNKGE